MIVSCPSCGTLYRHAAMHAVALAQCSCCAGAVPIAARRQYALRSAQRSDTPLERGALTLAPRPFEAPLPAATAPAPAAVKLGLDDPAPALTRNVAAESAKAPSPAVGAPKPVPSERDEDKIASPRRAGVMVSVLTGAAVGSLAGVAGAAWWGAAELYWWAGASLAGVVLGFGMHKAWTSRNH